MSPVDQPTNGAPKKPAARRKPRPKFEVPPEVTAAPPAAWVYRAQAAPRSEPPAAAVPVSPPAPRTGPPRPPIEGVPDPTSIMLAAIETMVVTVAAANRMFLAAASLMGAPIEVTRKILGL